MIYLPFQKYFYKNVDCTKMSMEMIGGKDAMTFRIFFLITQHIFSVNWHDGQECPDLYRYKYLYYIYTGMPNWSWISINKTKFEEFSNRVYPPA